MPDESTVEAVSQSYGRCCSQEGFFRDFYDEFMSRDPSIRAMFRSTDMSNQRQLLRGGILLLILHARGMSDSKLHALGKSHSHARMNIEPWMYGVWVDSLLSSVRRFDPRWQEEMANQWQAVLEKGLSIMQSHFDD